MIASVDYALSIFIGYFIRMFDDSFELTSGKIYIIFLLVLISHGLLNTFSVKLVRLLGDISVWWHVVGVAIIAGVLFIAPTNTRGIGAAFDKAPPGMTGWTGGTFVTIYLFALGLLLAQYTITGFDASAHVSEETVGARVSAPKAIVRVDLHLGDRRAGVEPVDDRRAARRATRGTSRSPSAVRATSSSSTPLRD